MREGEALSTPQAGAAVAEEPWTARLAIKNILCPVDFSEFSRRAFQYAVGIARHFQAHIFLQHSVHISPALFLEGTDPSVVQSALQASLRKANADTRRLVYESGVEISEVSLLVHEGDPRDSILEAIRQHKIDLLVMGTHGRKGFSRLLLGSVAEHVIHETICPVLVVSRPETELVALEEAEPVRLKTILLPTDFSPNSDRALTHALRWATEWGSHVILFHAVEEVPPAMRGLVDLFPEYNPHFEKQIAASWERIRKAIPEAALRACEITYEVRQGNAKEEILRYAEQKHPDLIVMGARGMGPSAVTWGSTISGVVRDGRFPVLAIRHLVG